MTRVYKLTTKRASLEGGDPGCYLTELTLNGEKVDFSPPSEIAEVIDHQGYSHIRVLSTNHKISKIEFIVYGED